MSTPSGNPLPEVVHATLTAERIGKGRIIVIGDIHGCPRELADLLTECGYQHGTDVVVSVGDLVGKGRQSVEVLREARRLGFITVRGNWDENALAMHRASQQGQALEEKWRWLEGVSPEDVDYIQSMPFSLSIPSHGCIVAHAGLVPRVPLQEQQLADLILMRAVGLVPDPTDSSKQLWKALPKFPRDAGSPWATVWPGPQHIIFGHHATRRLQMCDFATGIDTACVLGEKLTALVLPTLEELAARNWRPPAEGVTREALGAQLVSVPAREQYVVD